VPGCQDADQQRMPYRIPARARMGEPASVSRRPMTGHQLGTAEANEDRELTMTKAVGHRCRWRMAGCAVLVTAAVASSAGTAAADRAPGLSASPARPSLGAGWSGPVRLSARGGMALEAQVALDARGDAVAAWTQGHLTGNVQSYVVMASARRRAGGWMPPFQLSLRGETALDPEIAVGPAGEAVAVWQGFWPSRPMRPAFIQASFRRSPGRRWSRPVRISPAGMDSNLPEVGIDGHGHAVAIWAMSNDKGLRNQVEVSTLTIARGAWSRPVQLARPRPQSYWSPEVAVNAHGDAMAVWSRYIRGSVFGSPKGMLFAVVAAVKPAGQRSWHRPVVLGRETHAQGQDSATEEVASSHVAIDAKGDAVVVWQARSAGTIVPEFSARVGGRWRKPAPISKTPAFLPHVGMDARGDATAVWAGTGGSVVTASKPAAARRWSRPHRIFQGDPGFLGPFARIAVSPAGAAIITWEGTSVRAAVRPGPNAGWRPAVKLGSGGSIQPDFGQQGRVIVVWQRPIRHSIVIDAASHDPFHR
jgi:hypothetical protein